MTDGTSQGLFIVVAIVIFGIFTVMAYILFEDTLSPALASMFINATETASENLNKEVVFSAKNLKVYQPHLVQVHTRDRGSITFSTDGTSTVGEGVFIPTKFFDINKKYKLSYDLEVLGGEVRNIGGHMSLSDQTTITIDGVEHTVTAGDSYAPYPSGNDKRHVEIVFNTNRLFLDENGEIQVLTNIYPEVYIQPNRKISEDIYYKIKISNITLVEVL